MSKVVTAEYDATENVLRLDGPLDGVEDHEQVQIAFATREQPAKTVSGSLSQEAGESLARAVNELFPPWE
ncbi:MAG TPA: hypothetical protein VND45_17120 [Thermoanaerobaculia bacterium]|jgi:hypothetical protein|nr:hypothetical protein [Thermoanaerobaculia bacterium]